MDAGWADVLVWKEYYLIGCMGRYSNPMSRRLVACMTDTGTLHQRMTCGPIQIAPHPPSQDGWWSLFWVYPPDKNKGIFFSFTRVGCIQSITNQTSIFLKLYISTQPGRRRCRQSNTPLCHHWFWALHVWIVFGSHVAFAHTCYGKNDEQCIHRSSPVCSSSN